MLEIPTILQSRTTLFQRYFSELDHPLCKAVQTLLLVSDYACRNIDILQSLLSVDRCDLSITGDAYFQLLENVSHQSSSYFGSSLRQFRHYHFLRLLLREYSGLASTEETMAAWSDCADAIIMRALSFCQQELSARFGIAIEESGKPAQLYVLAMGKLGGRELNYSSDIDLIIAFSAAGHTDGQEQITNQQYYTKVVQLFIQLLQNVTADGFVFRVDLRLRPNGESGALVSSLAAIETYYQEQGRDWERYAMVKARLINESTNTPGHWFNRLIIPFTYRRYVDFSVIESLRSMKAMIEREVQLHPMLDDIKRGMGGIREVEFIIQNSQLIRGGRLPELRQQSALLALDTINHHKLMARSGALKHAYLFLRKLENCLQSENDQQTHSLPTDAVKQAQIAYAMSFASWDDLMIKLQQFQRIISTLFYTVLRTVDDYEDNERLLVNQLTSLWQGHVEHTMAINLLASLGFHDATRCYQLIHTFRHSPRVRRLNQAVRMRLDRFIVLLLNELIDVKETDTILLQFIHLLENIVGRSAYLALLTENPQTLKELVYWFGQSPFITSLIVGYPFLLEVFLQEDSHWRPFSRKALKEQLNNQLSYCEESELKEEVLRQFKLSNWLMAARAEMHGHVDAIRTGRFLADVAEVIVNQVVEIACHQLALRYPQIMKIKSKFAIIAYGKLGSQEMNYNSDLDLVFIHYTEFAEEGLITRLTQKIMHMLTTRLQFGILYQVDTRLRPSGEAGLLVSPLSAFVEYQRNEAWTWEHQALIRSRVLSGGTRARQVLRQLKNDVFLIKRQKQKIRDDVQAMRQKIIQHLSRDDVKHAPGGLLDLEFLVQFLVLVNPIPSLSRHTNTLKLLHQLTVVKIISPAQFAKFEQAYRHFHHVLHQHLLNPNILLECKQEQADVGDLCQKLLSSAKA
ncbi:MAG: bifunctional [glutamate--ammonia ligase]-adenylyl-L-tyrosine phosphorylase/[glutamate--ammonia-ligase] adenylyltransferase [Legionella sp.]|nr:bifunctional [glutamate--ammonia ligase]-adenylyl-L-tyrosine phosphorylase/[glutamate--ammonia-ligase] adenylyltransferase [Legionella sp.]